MITITLRDGENFDRMFNRYRSESRLLRLPKIVRANMFHSRTLSERKEKERAIFRDAKRLEKKKKMYY